MENLPIFIGSVGAVIGLIFALRKLYGWFFPLAVTPCIKIVRRDLGPDQVCVDIVNRSRDPIYIVKCRARSANKIGEGFRQHMRRPFTALGLLQSFYFGFNSFEMMGEEKIKLEPSEPKSIYRNMEFSTPISYVSTSCLVIELVLSSGRIIRSRRFEVPESWTIRSYLINRKKTNKID